MEPLFIPQVGWVGVAVAERAVLEFRVTVVVPVQPVAVWVTVTE